VGLGNVPFARISGLGPLPRLFEAEEGRSALHRLLAGEDLHLDGLALTTPVPFASLNEVFNRAARATTDRLFPVRVANAMRPEEYGPFVDYALGAPTLGRGIARLCRLGHLQSNASGLAFRNDGRNATWVLRYRAARGLRVDHHALHVLVPMIAFVRRYAGASASPIGLDLASPHNAAHRAIEDALRVTVRGGGGEFAVTFPSEWLRLAARPTQPVMTFREMIGAYREKALPGSMADTVAALVAPIVGHAAIDLDVIAGKLNVSRRTLQQRLNAEGSSFRDISLRVRIGRAKTMIVADDAAIAQVALAVGYSDQAHFTRAFKSMTGLTPQEFRQQHRPGPLLAAE